MVESKNVTSMSVKKWLSKFWVQILLRGKYFDKNGMNLVFAYFPLKIKILFKNINYNPIFINILLI